MVLETALYHHGYIMKRSRDREKNTRRKRRVRTQELTVWELKDTGLTELRMREVLRL